MRILIILILTVAVAVSAFGQQSLRPGQQAPNFTGQALDGQAFSLDQLQGKVVLLTFWSTRCQICHSEIPKLNRVVEHYRGQNVVFIGVTMDNQVKIDPYLRKNPFNFNILPNAFGVMLQYADRDRSGNINMGFPAHFLIDRRGAIAVRTDGWDKAENIDAAIGRLLSE